MAKRHAPTPEATPAETETTAPAAEEAEAPDPHADDERLAVIIEEWGLRKNHFLASAVELSLRSSASDTPAADLRRAAWLLEREARRLEAE